MGGRRAVAGRWAGAGRAAGGRRAGGGRAAGGRREGGGRAGARGPVDGHTIQLSSRCRASLLLHEVCVFFFESVLRCMGTRRRVKWGTKHTNTELGLGRALRAPCIQKPSLLSVLAHKSAREVWVLSYNRQGTDSTRRLLSMKGGQATTAFHPLVHDAIGR